MSAEQLDRAEPSRGVDLHVASVVGAFVVALIVQIVLAAWWASALSTRIGSIDDWMKANGGVEHRLAVIETQLKTLVDQRHAEARR